MCTKSTHKAVAGSRVYNSKYLPVVRNKADITNILPDKS